MDPDETTRASLTNLDLVAQWAGLEGSRDNARSVRGSLFVLMGLHGAEPPRTVGILPPDSVNRVIRASQIPDPAPATSRTPPTLAQFRQAGVFARTCRYICGRKLLLDQYLQLRGLLHQLQLHQHLLVGRSRCHMSPTKQTMTRLTYT